MAKAKPRKGGSGKNKKAGGKRSAPKKRAPKLGKSKGKGQAQVAGAPGAIGALRSGPIQEVDPGYYILKQLWPATQLEYEVGRVLVDNNIENWWLYTLTQPTGSLNGYTYPSSKQQGPQNPYQSQNVATRFVYAGTSTTSTVCQDLINNHIPFDYYVLTQEQGDCSQ
jgi:hypothetical protein